MLRATQPQPYMAAVGEGQNNYKKIRSTTPDPTGYGKRHFHIKERSFYRIHSYLRFPHEPRRSECKSAQQCARDSGDVVVFGVFVVASRYPY
jgi:hypothetical protein